MFLTETLDAPRDVNLLYHVYQEKFSNLFKKTVFGKPVFGKPVLGKPC